MNIDGVISGKRADVDPRNNLLVNVAKERTDETDLNVQGRYYIANIVALTPTAGAVRCFFAIENTDQRDIHITEVKLTCAAAEIVSLWIGGNNTLASTTALAVNPMTKGTQLGPSISAFTNAAITGFDANALQVGAILISGAGVPDSEVPRGRIIVPPQSQFFLKSTTSGSAINGYVRFCYPNALPNTPAA